MGCDKSLTRFFNDEGRSDIGDFYFNDYNYGYYPSQEFNDSKPGLGGRDITKPMPILVGSQWNKSQSQCPTVPICTEEG